jgi:phosphohistidine swiveling domain-containing protein
MAILEATEFARLDAARLIATARQMLDDFTTETHVRVEMTNIAASFHLTAACEALKAAGRDPAQCLGGEFDNDPLHALAAATSLPGSERRPAMIAAAGHRAVFDYELAEPRYGEDIAALEAHAEAYANITTIKTCRGAAHGGIAELPLRIAEMVETARRYQHLKEVAKDLSLRQLAVLRRILLAIDTAYALDDGVFHLLPDEVCRLPECNGAELRGLISTRRREREELLKVPALPSRLTRARIEVGAVPQTRPTADCEDGIIGQRVAGTGVVFGRARVLDAASCELGLEIEDLRDGDIIVCKMVHPAWLGEVLRSGGVVSEVGGWLSHMAIVAREHGVAMICGAAGIESIPDGAYVRLAPDGSVTVLDTNADDIPDASSVAMTG